MTQILYLIVRAVNFLVTALQIMMILRAVSSWLPFDEENVFINFIYTATEPLVAPVRNIMNKSKYFASSMFDFSFIVSYILLSFVSLLLEVCQPYLVM